MLFNSLHFLYFFLIVTPLYFLLPHRFRWQLLLAASVYFYMVFMPIYILILGFTIVVDYYAGIYIENSTGKRRKRFLIMSLIANIGVLAVFKYYNFLNENLSVLLNSIGYQNNIPNLWILLPVGLSFHTFQAMSYTIEVYRGNHKAERNFGIYSLYVMFYPQLVAGPIERPQNILYQFYERHQFDYQRVATGLKLMAWGLFKKVVIADRLSPFVDAVYMKPFQFEGFPLILATVFFAIQIYCDFSGYSDMAIGSARIMGFDLMKNFDRPYFSKSISEFWKRWHISLSTWFRDYLYISMGGNRKGEARTAMNLLITFVISGLWHGANWTYVVWGGLNGLFLVIENYLRKFKILPKGQPTTLLGKAFGVIITFCLINLTWIFFRANSISEAYYIITHLFTNFSESFTKSNFTRIKLGKYDVAVICSMVAILFIIEFLQRKHSLQNLVAKQPIMLRRAIYVGLVVLILFFGMFDRNAQFIYFQF